MSEFERAKLEEIGATTEHGTLVRNPVDTELWETADPALFRETYGISDYVLCVGRLETRKNQLLLLHALRGTGLPIVLIGHRPQASYYQRLLALAEPNVRIIERLDPGSPMLASAVAGARVFVLPSWAEGAPLSALEAASAGVSLVLSDASGEREYFGDMALYCDPGDPASIRDAVLTAYGAERPASIAIEQRAYVRGNFSWATHVEQTQRVYAETIARHRSRLTPAPLTAPATKIASRPTVIFDVTTSAGRKGRWTGISRVEMALAQALQQLDINIFFVAWNGSKFVPVPRALLTPELLSDYLSDTKGEAASPSYPSNSVFVVAGSGWMQSAVYPNAVIAFARNWRMSLCSIIYDIIPYKFPHWFEPKYAPTFISNLSNLLEHSDIVISDSNSTRSDLAEFAQRFLPHRLDIRTMRCGDEIQLFPNADQPPRNRETVTNLAQNAGYVLSVGALHTRKNQGMLCELWSVLRTSLGSRCPKLVIVGGVAWNGQDVARRIAEDRSLANLVVMLDDVEDDELEILYKNCLLTVYPSLYEGWGLPVAESLRYGKICLASSSSSIPEIAPELTDLIDPRDFPTWLAKLKFYLGNIQARQTREAVISVGYKRTSWVETATELIDHLSTRQLSAPIPYPIGTILDFSKFTTLVQFGAGGWLMPEKWGVWSGSETAHVTLSLATPPCGRLVLIARVQSLATKSVPYVCDVLCNGQTIATWHLAQAGMHTRTALVPVADGLGCDPLTITFHNRVRRRPSDLQLSSTDTRLLGIGLTKLTLAEASRGEVAQTYMESSDKPYDLAELGRFYNFIDDTNARRFLLGNWKLVNEAWGCCEENDNLKIGFSVLDYPTEDLQIELEVRPVSADTHPLVISILLTDGSIIASGRFLSDEVQIISATIPADIRQAVQPTMLHIIGRATGSPASLKLGPYIESFKLGVLSMKITTKSSRDIVPTYHIGEIVTFSDNNHKSPSSKSNRSYLQKGWNIPDGGATWSRSKTSVVKFDFEDIMTENLVLTTRMDYFDRNVLCELKCNGFTLDNFGAVDETEVDQVYIIPAQYLRPDDTNTLTFESSGTVNPYQSREIGDVSEDRRLGVRLWSFAMITPFRLKAGQALLLGSEEASRAAVSGWHYPEVGGRWTKSTARIVISNQLSPTNINRLIITGWSHDASTESPLIVEIYANGHLMISNAIEDNCVSEISFEINPKIRHYDELIVLDIKLNRASMPNSNESGFYDHRKLGLFVRQLYCAIS